MKPSGPYEEGGGGLIARLISIEMEEHGRIKKNQKAFYFCEFKV